MENQDNLVLNQQAVDALRESAKWSLFLSILGFIGIGLMLLAAVFMTSFMSMMPDQPMHGGFNPFDAMKGFISVFYVILAVLYFFPIFYLYKYAKGMKQATEIHNSEMLSDALVYLKSHHKFLGITAIVVISLYILVIIGVIIFAVTKMGSGM